MNCDSSVVHFSLLDRIAISLAVCSCTLIFLPPMLICYVETLRKFKASKENSQQIESIRRNEIENYLIRTNICFITVYCVLILPFLLVNTIDSNMKTIPVWTHGLARYLEMSSYTVLTQILYFIQCSTGKWNLRFFNCQELFP